jgi:hypothetical protein
VEIYGEDDARYLMETLGGMHNYMKMAYIDTKVGDFDEYKKMTEEMARERGWEYEELEGSTNLLMRLLNGEWNDEDFLIVPPGGTIATTHGDDIVKTE